MKISKLILLACVWGSIVSCEDLLDPKLTNEWSSETVWTNPDMAQAVLTQVYADLMVVPDHYDDNFLDAATDNALTRNYGSSVYRASMGAFSRSTNPLGNWDNMYDKIQSINLFMEKGVTDDVIYNRVSKETDQAIKTRLLGAASNCYKLMEDEQTKEKHWDIRSPTISLVIRNLRSRACLNVTRIKIASARLFPTVKKLPDVCL